MVIITNPNTQHVVVVSKAAWQTRRQNPLAVHVRASASAPATTVSPTNQQAQPRRLFVAADGTDESLEAMQWAVHHLLDPSRRDIVHLAYVVNDPRTPQMAVDTTRGGGVQWSPILEQQQLTSEWRQRLEEQGRQLLLQRFVPPLRAGGLAYEVDVLRQRGARSAAGIGELLCGASTGMWALLVASHGAGILADFGSVAQYCVQHAPCPLVLVPPPSAAPPPKDAPALLVSFGDAAGLERCARFAADLLHGDGVAAASAVLVHADQAVEDATNLAQLVATWGGARLHVESAETMLQAGEASEDSSGHTSKVGAQLCKAAAHARVVIMCAPAGGLVQELLYGPALGHVLRHCDRPVVLLK